MSSTTDAIVPGVQATEGQAPNDGEGQGPEPEQPKTFDAVYVSKLREEAAKFRKRAEALEAEDAKRAAETKAADELRLAEQQKWQELAQKRQDDLTAVKTEADTLKAQSTRLAVALNGYLEKERAGVPEHIAALLDKLDVVDQLSYIASNREAWAANPQRPAGVPPSPKAGTPPTLTEEERRQRSYQIRL